MKTHSHAALHRMGLVALVTLTACAIMPLQPDLDAKAPVLEGFGSSDTPVTTRSEAARQFYRAGVLQAYAFNEKEAVRQFKAALAADPSCAMCAWGVAWQLGPNINAQKRGDLSEARQYVDYARRHSQNASARERALIDAMAVRYDVAERAGTAFTPSEADVCGTARASKDANPLDTAYAERMHALVTAFPEDADILSLWSEAAMIAIKDDWYDKTTGKALPPIAEMVDRLEALRKSKPEHTGLNHYLIHAADDPSNAARAVAAADLMATLAPGSPHLVHMPAHIYAHVGRYADAAARNESALAVEDALDAAQKAQGFAVSKDWRGHNTHFLWYAALMQGRGDAALVAARSLADRAKRDSAWSEFFRSLPTLTLLRLERWDALLSEPLATGERGMAVVTGQQARGVALVRLGRLPEARTALQEAEAGAATLQAAHASADKGDVEIRNVADAMLARLRAELAAAERRTDEALAQQARAVAASKSADDSEPPRLANGARLALGDLQLQLGRPVDAEATFRADLAVLPDSGWALNGLARALEAQGKTAEAAAVRGRAERAWPQADAALKARG
jgi:tetratricopeptide (TPR) repeat protein